MIPTTRQPGRTLTAALLTLLLAAQPLLAAAPASKKSTEIKGKERTLHALNRLSFGPRPGDLAAVQQMGLKRWFEQQLDPASIDDSALDARLDNFPAMRLPQEELMHRFPSPQLLRATENRGLPLPSDPTERAIYADHLAFYKLAQAKKAEKKGTDTTQATPEMMKQQDMKQGADNVALPGDLTDPATPAMATHVESLYSGLEAVKVINLPPDQRMARILAMSPKELIAFRQSLSKRELVEAAQGLSPQQREILISLNGSTRLIGGEILQSRLLRDIYSNRQLEAVMTDFWLNHFNIYIRKNQNEPYLLPSFERDVVRPNALGNFETLLVATAKSPAMLVYLDNWQSTGPDSTIAQRVARQKERNPNAKFAKARASGLNENYARELMELHTLGVGGGYTQADVTQVAKVFTGWTIERPFQGASYQFDVNRHEGGSKQVLGTTISSSGEAEGLKVLHMLATSPATAKFISTKLAVRFVSDTPPPALVDRMTQAFLSSHGDIKTVLRTMFDSPEFWSPAVVRAKVKTPLEFVASAARATDAEVTNAQPLVQSLNTLGMPLYGMQTPNGYSWMAEPWVSTGALVSRLNFALVLTADHIQGVRTGLNPFLGQPASGIRPVALTTEGTTPVGSFTDNLTAEKEMHLELLLLGQPVSDRTRSTVLQQFQDSATQQQAEKDFPIKAGDPEQMANRLPGGRLDPPLTAATNPLDKQTATMAGLLLGSPEFQRR